MSVPLSLEQQQLHKLSSSPKSLSSEGLSTDKGLSTGGSTGTTRWTSRESFSSNSLGRKALGVSGSSSLGKEKLVNRLRQREQLGMLVMADREMADAELLSYREDLENQDCLTQMDDLQVRIKKQLCTHSAKCAELGTGTATDKKVQNNVAVDLNACITELGLRDTSPPAVHYTTLM